MPQIVGEKEVCSHDCYTCNRFWQKEDTEEIMKLILAIMSNDDSPAVSSALTKENYQVTRLATTGGFLRAGNTTLIIGTEDDRVERAIEVIGEYSRRRTEVVPSTASYDIGRYASFPMEVQVGGATIFVVDVEQFVKL